MNSTRTECDSPPPGAAYAQDMTTLSVIDGYLVDPDTGEIHGLATVASDFHVTDIGAAEWVMQRLCETDAAIVGIDAKQRAILANLDAERRHQLARRKWIMGRFGPELEAFARANLKGKVRTWRCAYGTVTFRKTQPGVEIVDEVKALAWVRYLDIPDSIKITQKIMLSVVKDALVADPPPEACGIVIVPEGESVKIDTGVGK